MKKLGIIGAGGHGKVLADIAIKNDYKEIIFFDDDITIKECAGYPVVGTSKEIEQYKDYDFIVAVGNATIRKTIQTQLEQQNYSIATLIHPNATISRRVQIDKGAVVMAGAVINSDTIIKKGCIINTCASLDHDNYIEEYSHISVGAHLGGTVKIGKNCWIGIGSTIINNCSLCDDCVIGAGAVVVKDIDTKGTYVGVPAKKIK